MRKTYQGTQSKSKRKFELIGKQELLVQVPLPMAEVWEELQAQVEQLTGHAGLRIIGTILEDEVTRRVGPSHRPDRRPARCVGDVSRVTWCLVGRRWPSLTAGAPRGERDVSTRTRGCNTTGGGSGRCGKVSSPG